MLAGIFEFRRSMIPQIIAFLVATRGLGSREDYRRFFLCLIALAIIMGLFVFWDVFFDCWLLKSEMLFKPEYYMNRKQGRFGGVFLNPNFLGAFVVLVFPPAFVWTLNEHQRGWRLFAWTGLLALVFSLVQTQSRGPLLAFGGSSDAGFWGHFLGCRGYDDPSFLTFFLALSFHSLFFFMPGFFQHAAERFATLDNEESEVEASRQTNWIYTGRIIADHPLGGVGFGEQQFQGLG